MQGPEGLRCGPDLSNIGIISDGSVLIRDGQILSVGTTRRLENLKEARGATEIPVHGKVVLPGFIDAGLRLQHDQPAGSSRPRRAVEFLDDSVGLLRACLQHGTVTAKVHASARAGPRAEVSIMRKLDRVGEQLVRIVRTWCLDLQAPRSDFAMVLQTLRKRRLIDGISVTLSSDGDPAISSVDEICSAGVPIDLIWPGGPLTTLRAALDRFAPRLVHLVHPLTSLEAALLARRPSITLLSAGRHLLEGAGDAAAVRSFIEEGGPLALSTGYHSTAAPNFNMQMAITLAVVRLGLTPEEAVAAATVNAAHAIGQQDETGSLQFRKRADILVLNVADIHDLPRHFGVNHVAMVFRNGNMVLNRTRWRMSSEATANRMRTKPL